MTIYSFKGYHNRNSKCGLKIIKKSDKALVIISELSDNSGTPVADCSGKIATEVYSKFLTKIPIERILWVEHYLKKEGITNTYNRVEYDNDGMKFIHPKRTSIGETIDKVNKLFSEF